MQIHKDDRNKRNTSSIKVQHPIRKRSKPSILLIDKTTYSSNHLLCFNVFYFMLFLNFRLFISFLISTKSYKVRFMSLISFFAIFSISNLNLCHKNFDLNKNHFKCKTFTTDILNINRILGIIIVTWQKQDTHILTNTTVNTSSKMVWTTIYSGPRRRETKLYFIGLIL